MLERVGNSLRDLTLLQSLVGTQRLLVSCALTRDLMRQDEITAACYYCAQINVLFHCYLLACSFVIVNGMMLNCSQLP